MKKKLIGLSLCFVLALAMSGCSAAQAQEPEQSQEPPKQSESVPSVEPTQQPAEPSMDVPGVGDGNVTGTKASDEGAGGEQPTAAPTPSVAPTPEVVPVSAVEEAVDPFTACKETVYTTSSVNLRSGPGTDYEKVGGLKRGDSVTRVGVGTGDVSNWSRIQLSDGSIVYVSSKYVSTEKPVVETPAPKKQQAPKQQTQKPQAKQSQQQQQAPAETPAPTPTPAPAPTPAPQQSQQSNSEDPYTSGLTRRNTAGFDVTKHQDDEEWIKAYREASGITEEQP